MCCSSNCALLMKTTFTCWILGLLLLGLSRKKPVEPVIPKLPADCRIIATVYKTTTKDRESGPKYDLETITLSDGNTATISRVLNTYYNYDDKGRIIEQNEKWPNGDYRLTKFIYSSGFLITYSELLASSFGNKLRMTRDTISLYPTGFLSRAVGVGLPDNRYNQEGQKTGSGLLVNRPAGDSCRYENGNCVQKIQGPLWQFSNGRWFPTDYLLITYRYDLNRTNIRPFRQFEGKPSRNLPLTEHWETKASSQFPDGLVYQKAYLYTFDQYGRVIRRIAHGKTLYGGWLIQDDYNGVGVTDYIYECP